MHYGCTIQSTIHGALDERVGDINGREKQVLGTCPQIKEIMAEGGKRAYHCHLWNGIPTKQLMFCQDEKHTPSA